MLRGVTAVMRQLAHQRVALLGGHGGQHGLALAGAVQRLALAQGRVANAGSCAPSQRSSDTRLHAVQRGQVGGLAGHVAQRAQFGRRGRHQVGHGVGGARVLETAQAQAVHAPQRVTAQQAARHQRAQQPVQRGARQRQRGRQLGLAQARRRAAHRVQHVQGLVERGGAVGGRSVMSACASHACGTSQAVDTLRRLGRPRRRA
jgi:hypothetical protein